MDLCGGVRVEYNNSYHKKEVLPFFIIILMWYCFIWLSPLFMQTTREMPTYIQVFCVLYLIFCIVLLFTNRKITIEDRTIKQTTYLWKFPIYEVASDEKDIQLVKFKRFGWSKKGAVIKRHKGGSIRIIEYKSSNILSEIENFVKNDTINATFSKDYKLLSRKAD